MMNIGQRVRVKRTGQGGIIVGHGSDNKYEVQFADHTGTPYRGRFSEEELEPLATRSATEINEEFSKRFKKTLEETSNSMTDPAEKQTLKPKTKKEPEQ
jgi:uncharacterized protein YodC (DUF2158 family)